MKNLILSLGIIMSMIFGVKAQETPQTPTDNPNSPEIKFDTYIHDYGTIEKGADGHCTFTFTNTGKEPLIVSYVSWTDPMILTYPRNPVLPGQKGKIEVHYDTNHLGNITKQIGVISNAKTGTVILHIKGNVVVSPATNTPDKPVNNNVPTKK